MRSARWTVLLLASLPTLWPSLTRGQDAGAGTGGSGIPPHAAPQSPPGQAPSLAPLIERVRPTVVGVTTERDVASQAGDLEDLLRRFFGDQPGMPMPPGGDEPVSGLGSGVIIDPKGVILTNNHVVAGATEVLVRTWDEKEYVATVKGADPATDVAVLQLKDLDRDLPAATLGASEGLRIGDYVIAIGNPFGLELTVTTGIISAKARVIGAGPYDDFLQTDAAINPGNSGGPLFDLQGRVVGINTAIVATGQGIGFAVPIDLVRSLLPQLLERGKVQRGYIGVGIQDVTPDLAQALGLGSQKGALVASVEPGGPGEKAGLKTGDVVVSLDGQPVGEASDLTRRVAEKRPGQKTTLEVLGERGKRRVELVLAERPAQPGEEPAETEPPEQEGGLGLQLQAIPRELAGQLGTREGALVAGVTPGSRASRSGLQRGDVIVEVNRKPVRSPQDLRSQLRSTPADKPLALRVLREGAARYVVIPPARKK